MDHGAFPSDVVLSGGASTVSAQLSPQGADGGPQKRRKHQQPKPVDPVALLRVQGTINGSIIVVTFLLVLVFSTGIVRLASTCPSCSRADQFMQGIADTSVSPCDNFYQYVCGRWISTGNATLKDFVLQVGRQRFVEALLVYPSGFRSQSWTFDLIASFYKSCVKDLSAQRSLTSHAERYAEATGFSWNIFQQVSDMTTFLDLIAKMTVQYTLNPCITIVVRAVGITMAPVGVAHILSNTEVRSALSAMKSYLSPLITQEIQSEVENLHNKTVEALTDPSLSSMDPTVGTLSEIVSEIGLGSVEEWMAAVQKYTVGWENIQSRHRATLFSPMRFKDLLTAIYRRQNLVRSLYLYVYVVRDIMGVVSTNSEVKDNAGAASTTCLDRLEAEPFFAVRTAFILYSFATERTVTSIKDMLSHVTLQMVVSISSNKRLDAETKVPISMDMRSYSFKPVFSEPYITIKELHKAYNLFPRNLTIYHSKLNLNASLEHGTFETFRLQSECMKSGDPLFNYRGGACASPFITISPMFYPDARLSYNYGLLGFYMASQAIRDFLKGTSKPTNVADAADRLVALTRACHRKHSNVDNDFLGPDLVSYVLGMRAAFDAYVKWRLFSVESTGEDRAERQVFFKRACMSVCSEFGSHVPPGGDALGAEVVCNTAVRSMPEFYSAFKCSASNNMSRNGVCRFF
ncbi:uncharacterized protein LOC135390109 [Ornithodoros turicata]|uniref:uncharacterized protein LOC135390109 n=1 Tax=Ornithodoros turicata TaxID=34597 RepID=UPI003139DB6C